MTAGYNWIQTPFSIFMGHYLTKFCNKFDSTLLDSTRSSQFGRKGKNVNDGCFLFTIDFNCLYTLSKIKKVSYSERNNLFSKIHPDSDHFFNIVQEMIALGMLMNLARRKISAWNKSTASRTQSSMRRKNLQRFSLFQQQIRWNLCLVQTQGKKKNQTGFSPFSSVVMVLPDV